MSRDLEFNDTVLWVIIGLPDNIEIPLLEFDHLPDDPEDIHLERHGCLLMLAARAASAKIFGSGLDVPQFPVFPDVAQVFTRFLSRSHDLGDVKYDHPPALLDALVVLAIHAVGDSIGRPSSDGGFKRFVITLTGCTVRQNHGIVRLFPGEVIHKRTSHTARFKLIYETLKDYRLQFAWDSAISWLKQEIGSKDADNTIFRDPLHFWVLFPHLWHAVRIVTFKDLVQNWMLLIQTHGAVVHSALNLYYLLLSSEHMTERLHLEKTVPFFRGDVLRPLRTLFREIEADLPSNGGAGLIENSVGEEMCTIGNARSVGFIGLRLDEIEKKLDDLFGTDDNVLAAYSAEEEARVSQIRRDIENG